MKVFRYTCPECEFESAFLTEKDKYLCADCGLVVVVKKKQKTSTEPAVQR